MSAKGRKTYYSLRAFLSYLATYKGRFALVFVLFVIAEAALAVIPYLIGRFVAVLAAQPLVHSQVYTYMGLLLACSVGHDFSWRAAEFLYLKLINAKSYEFENIIFHTIISKRYPYFVGKFTGKISSYLSTLGKEFKGFTENIFYSYSDYLVKLPIIAATMFTVNAYTGMAFLVSLLIMFMVGRVTVRRSLLAEKDLTNVTSDMDGYIIDVIANFVSVKAFKKEHTEFNNIQRRRLDVIKASNHSFFWSMVFWGSLGILVRIVIWPGTILLNTYLFLEGRIDLAQMTTFLSAIMVFSDYIWGTIWTISQFSLKLARIEEAYQYLFGKKNVIKEYLQGTAKREAAEQRVPLAFNEALELKDLSFAYPDKKDRLVLSGINLRIAKNEKVGIVGRSGGGKTTLIKLLLGHYRVSPSCLALDGRPLDNERLAELISYVPQDTSLFHRSLQENIAYTSGGATHTEIVQAAHRAHAAEFIEHSPQGYNTVVGERGIKLSMGQRQRIAIARAFLDNKQILVLDEATSALDSESEVLIQEALEDLWQGKTVIAIAHRLSTLRHMDRIVVMDNGTIIEQGSHRDLLEKQGAYWRLWQHQSGGMILED